jgi:pimeloyl-ACP methyl ester carboxylesterase
MADEYGFSERWYSAPDGLRLYARVYGEEIEGPLPVVCLAGLTRNCRDFHQLALHLSQHAGRPRKVVCFDYRGRGKSAYDRNWKNYDILVETGDVIAGLTALGIAHGAFIGTSRGGLIIHALAALRPAALKAVVLNDVGPVVEGAGLAQIRARLERAPRPRTFDEALALQKAAGAHAFPALRDEDWERMVRAFYRNENGRPVADFDPALLKTLKSIDFNKPLPVFWPQFLGLGAIPLLAIRGENSALLSAQTLSEMASRHSRIQTVTVPGQGHAPLLETAGLPERIRVFLEKADDRAG